MNHYDTIPFAFATLVVLVAWWRDRRSSRKG